MSVLEAELRFEFERTGHATHYRTLRQSPPWKVVRGFPRKTGECLVHLNNISGGVFGGDCLRVHGTLHRSAEAQITTTGATRLYRPRNGAHDVLLRSEFHLKEGALLEYVPDALIPYRDARATQHTTFVMEQGSTLFAWDTIAPGRVAHGERFLYEHLRLITEVNVSGRPVLLDRLLLEPRQRSMHAAAAFGRSASYLVTFLVVQAGAASQTMRSLETSLNALLGETVPAAHAELWGASMLPAHGVLVRGAGESALHLTGLLQTLWSHCKRELMGREAVPPRKTY